MHRISCWLSWVGHSFSCYFLSATSREERQFTVVHTNVSGELVCTRVLYPCSISLVAVGCIHGNIARLSAVLRQAASADVLCLLGDFLDNAGDTLPELLAALTQFHTQNPSIPVLAILGNNDVFYAATADTAEKNGASVSNWKAIKSVLHQKLEVAGVQVLVDQRQTLTIHDTTVTVYGMPELELFPPYGDPEPWVSGPQRDTWFTRLGLRLGIGFSHTSSGRKKPGKGFRTREAVLAVAKEYQCNLEGVDLILAHNPDWVYHPAVQASAALVVSSHTHGLQHGIFTLLSVLRRKNKPTRFGFSTFSGYAAGRYTQTPNHTPCNLAITAGLVGVRHPGSAQAPDYLWISSETK